ncbi:hypothetical protein Taro_016151 [Colocasia esculenta]|uniref:Uncharacterized protein n=1 Tax=Colocasia esculenta TaxID=4460 RepID=A0A843UJH9_COLES|nr:hypothetical protein [Colocasia esculenta]
MDLQGVVAYVCDSLVKVVTIVVCPGGGMVLWFSVVPRGSRYWLVVINPDILCMWFASETVA